MKKRKDEKKGKFNLAVFFILCLGILFLFGCKPEKKVETEELGLKLEFIQNAPPTEVKVNQKFPIWVDVSNLGEWNVPVGKANFYLLGVGTNLKDYANKLTNQHELLARTDGAIGKERLIFATNAYSDLSLKNPFDFNLVLNSCWDYATIAQIEICIAKESSEICSLEGNKVETHSNTKAPIQITSLTEKVEGDELILEFLIENKGKGKVYLPNLDCDKLILETDVMELMKENLVKLLVQDGGLGFKCRLLDEKLSSKEDLSGYANLGLIRCSLKIGEEKFKSLLRIILEYKYRTSTTKTLTILP